MEINTAKAFFRRASVVEHYAQAANAVGLWNSEEHLFTQYFKPENSLLELGCGAGRITFGLWELGYKNILAIDYAREMVQEARRINHALEYSISFQQGDATELTLEENQFAGAIFGFNGLMQIPGRDNRLKAMSEIFRVLQPGAYFIFTGHDREVHWRRHFWKEQRRIWDRGEQHPELTDFGDLYFDAPEGGMMFIHSASPNEVRRDLKSVGFRVESDALRSNICPEPDRVRDFSDDTRFWIAQKPE